MMTQPLHLRLKTLRDTLQMMAEWSSPQKVAKTVLADAFAKRGSVEIVQKVRLIRLAALGLGNAALALRVPFSNVDQTDQSIVLDMHAYATGTTIASTSFTSILEANLASALQVSVDNLGEYERAIARAVLCFAVPTSEKIAAKRKAKEAAKATNAAA